MSEGASLHGENLFRDGNVSRERLAIALGSDSLKGGCSEA